jgi:hypothetical protein
MTKRIAPLAGVALLALGLGGGCSLGQGDVGSVIQAEEEGSGSGSGEGSGTGSGTGSGSGSGSDCVNSCGCPDPTVSGSCPSYKNQLSCDSYTCDYNGNPNNTCYHCMPVS